MGYLPATVVGSWAYSPTAGRCNGGETSVEDGEEFLHG
jgi:hypothetical protein